MATSDKVQYAFDLVGGRRLRPTLTEASFNLFLAILPDREIAMRAAEIAGDLKFEYSLGGNLRSWKLMHLTMFSFGAFRTLPEELVHAVAAAMPGIHAAPVGIVLDQALSFRHAAGKPLVLCGSVRNGGLLGLHARLVETLGAGGITGPRRQLTPHMTLFYDHRLIPRTPIARPLVWTAQELVLVQSVVGKSRHIHLDRWPLLG